MRGARSEMIRFKCRPSERARWEAAAVTANVSLSEYIRRALEGYMHPRVRRFNEEAALAAAELAAEVVPERVESVQPEVAPSPPTHVTVPRSAPMPRPRDEPVRPGRVSF
jgi:hypothetical protein